MLIKSEIKNLIEKSVLAAQKDGKLPVFDLASGGKSMVVVDRPTEKIHGDYSTNIGLRLAKNLKQDPRLTERSFARMNPARMILSGWHSDGSGQACEIATMIGDYVLANSLNIVSRVEVVHPGFLNIFLSDKFIQKQVVEILKQKEKFGSLKSKLPANPPKFYGGKLGRAKDKKVLIEFLSANPTGQLHLGHGRNAFWGDALANVLKKAGYSVKKEYYINDAKSSNQIKELGKTALGQGTSYLNEYLKNKLKVKSLKLKDLIKNTKNKEELYGEAGYLMAGDLLRDLKKFIEKDLKIKFDNWFSEEKELYEKKLVEKIHKWLKNNNFIYEKEGAQWLKIGEYGDSEDRVLVRSDDARTPTYLLPDIAYHQNKIKRGFGRLINIWGADHQGHVKSIKAALKMIGFGGQFDVLITQMVLLKEGEQKLKLSKRKGKIITMESLVKEVGLDSVRFFYLLKSLDTQMELDMTLMKEQSSKNPVFYVQYAHARIASILAKLKVKPARLGHPPGRSVRTGSGGSSKLKVGNSHLELLSTESELDLIKELTKLPELVEEISRDYQVHKLTHYAISLADKFHRFYHECKVITEDDLLTDARLALITAVKITLKNTLDLLGVSAPDKM